MSGILSPGANAYFPAANAAADKYGVPREIMLSVIQQESSFNPNVPDTGARGDAGMMQLSPPVYTKYGVDPHNPTQAFDGGAHYLADLYKQYGSWDKAVKAYNGSGPMADAYSAEVMNRAAQLGYNDANTARPWYSDPVGSASAAIQGAASAAGSYLGGTVNGWLQSAWTYLRPYLLQVFVVIAGGSLILLSLYHAFDRESPANV